MHLGVQRQRLLSPLGLDGAVLGGKVRREVVGTGPFRPLQSQETWAQTPPPWRKVPLGNGLQPPNVSPPHLHEQHSFSACSRTRPVKMFSRHPGGKPAVCAWELCAGPRGFHFYILSEPACHAQSEMWWEVTLREGSCVLLIGVCVGLKLWEGGKN